MTEKYVSAGKPGLMVKKHPTRKNGLSFDRCYKGEYMCRGERNICYFGWASETKLSESKCYAKLIEYKENNKNGVRPISPKDEKDLQLQIRKKREEEESKKQKENTTINIFFNEIYKPSILKTKKERTAKREISLYTHWIENLIGDKTFKDITKIDIEDIYYNIIDHDRSIRTAEYTLTTLKQIWRDAKENNYCGDFPKINKSINKTISSNDNSRKRYLSKKEADVLLAKLKLKSQILYEKSIISLHCGLRADEIHKLKWVNIDFENKKIILTTSKNNKGRELSMTIKVREILENKIKGSADQLVFPGKNGKKSDQISKEFKKIADELFNINVEERKHRVTFHTLRHTFASWLVMEDISLYLVQKVMGHSTIQVTERYAHLAPNKIQLVANTINKIYD